MFMILVHCDEYLALYVVYGNAEVMVVLVMYHSSIEVDSQRFLDVMHQNKGKHPSNYLNYEHHGDHHTELLYKEKRSVVEIQKKSQKLMIFCSLLG